jgi:replicative DNA helicase
MNDETFETLLLKLLLQDKQYLITVTSVFDKEYFTNRTVGEIVWCAKQHYEKYHEIPPVQALEDAASSKEDFADVMLETSTLDFDFAKNYDYFLDTTNNYLKNQAIKQSIIKSVDLINNDGDITEIRGLIENALCKDIRIDLGTDYFGSLGERLQRILSCSENRIPTYYPMIDEVLNGGFLPYTLSAFGAAVHGGKSSWICNMAGRQVLHGHNPVLLSLEMSELAFSQRFDAMFSLKDINRIYTVRDITTQMITKLKELKNTEGRGTLFIKQYPAGTSSIQDFRIYLRELKMRGIDPSIVYVDYLQLMKASSKNTDNSMYSRGKIISEELRALSFEFKIPIVTLSQIKPALGRESIEDIDIYAFQESSAIPATADCTIVFGRKEDEMVYEQELYYKVTKNRLGGRVGYIGKIYMDSRSLKFYDETELEMWLADVKESSDVRELHERRN